MNKPISASRLNQRLVLQKPVYAQDELGGAMISWQDSDELWAEIVPAQGIERFKNQRIESRQQFRIFIRRFEGVKVSHRFRQGDRIFSILSVAEADSQNFGLEIMAEELT